MADIVAKRRFSSFYLVFIGLLIGFAFSSWLAPKAISWYSEPPYSMGVNCTPAIDWALGKVVIFQVIGVLLGASALWSLSFFASKKAVNEELTR